MSVRFSILRFLEVWALSSFLLSAQQPPGKENTLHFVEKWIIDDEFSLHLQ